jgi:hypothetical protein
VFFLACLLTCALQTSSIPVPIDAAHFVSVIAADIDADGDLDVIASDRSLQIYVWVNDGAGHFTQQEPVHATTWQALPPAPTFENGPTSDPSVAPPNPAPLQFDRSAIAAPAVDFSRIIVAAAHALGRPRSLQSCRAPPPSGT